MDRLDLVRAQDLDRAVRVAQRPPRSLADAGRGAARSPPNPLLGHRSSSCPGAARYRAGSRRGRACDAVDACRRSRARLPAWPATPPADLGRDAPEPRGGRRRAAARLAPGAVPACDRRAVARRAPGPGRRRPGLVLGRGRGRHRDAWQRRPSEVLDASRGPAWARWWGGGAFDYARAATEPRAADDPGARRSSGRARMARSAADQWRAPGRGRGSRPPLPRTRDPARRPGRDPAPAAAGDRVTVLALGRIGAIYTPIFSGYAAPAVATRLADCDASVLVTADGFLAAAGCRSRRSRTRPRRSRRPFAGSSSSAARAMPSPRVGGSARRLVARGAGDDERPASATRLPTDPETPYLLIYTSGTTGRPKAAVHVHGGFPIKGAQDLAHWFDLRAGDTLFWFTDLGWMMGPWAISGALLLGARLVLYEGAPDYPGPDRLWDRRAPPGHPSGTLADGHPRADGARRGASPEPRPQLAARPRLDRRAVEPGAVVVVLPRGRRRPLPDHQLLGRDGGQRRHRRLQPATPIKPTAFSGSVHRDGRGRRRRRRASRCATRWVSW